MTFDIYIYSYLKKQELFKFLKLKILAAASNGVLKKTTFQKTRPTAKTRSAIAREIQSEYFGIL